VAYAAFSCKKISYSSFNSENFSYNNKWDGNHQARRKIINEGEQE
jgi:hypothetical protein